MEDRQSIVWMDHREARVFQHGTSEPTTVRASAPHDHRHPKGPTAEHHHPDDLRRFFEHVAAALEGSGATLLVGPGTAKLQFLRYLTKFAPAVEGRVVGLETVDHPTDRQIAAYGAKYFQSAGPSGR